MSLIPKKLSQEVKEMENPSSNFKFEKATNRNSYLQFKRNGKGSDENNKKKFPKKGLPM